MKISIANEQLALYLKTMTNFKSIASRIETRKSTAKHRKCFHIYEYLKEYLGKKSHLEVSKVIRVYIHIVFTAILNEVLIFSGVLRCVGFK